MRLGVDIQALFGGGTAPLLVQSTNVLFRLTILWAVPFDSCGRRLPAGLRMIRQELNRGGEYVANSRPGQFLQCAQGIVDL